jgi:hypothetical protein
MTEESFMDMVGVNLAILVTAISSKQATLNQQNSLKLELGGIQ